VSCVCEGLLVKQFRITGNPDKLAKTLNKLFQDAKIESAYESGFSGFVLHRVLSKAGIKNRVVNASDVETTCRRDKTDKRDSRRLAEQLSANRFVGIYIPSETEEQKRLLSRTREQLIRKRTRIKNQIRMRLHYFGLLDAECREEMSERLVAKVLKKIESAELVLSIKALVEVWRGIDEQLKRIEKALKEQAKEDAYERIYRKVPGIGWLSSRILSNELGDLRRFHSQKALFRYTGLVPTEYSSGEERKLGRISREGSSRLRHVLVEAAWNAIRKDKNLRDYFDRLSHRAGKKRAIVAVARKLIGRARALFLSNENYQLIAA
jgi:transposase